MTPTPYQLDGQPHLAESLRLTGREIARRSHMPETRSHMLMLEASGGNPERAIRAEEVVDMTGRPSFLTRHSTAVAKHNSVQGLIAA